MCPMSKFAPLMAVIPISLLLTLSFFVLLSLKKADTKGLKVFGYVVASLLWLAVLVIFLGGVYKIAKSSYSSKCMHQNMMMGKMSMMEKQKPAESAMVKEAASSQEQKPRNAGHCGNKGMIYKAH